MKPGAVDRIATLVHNHFHGNSIPCQECMNLATTIQVDAVDYDEKAPSLLEITTREGVMTPDKWKDKPSAGPPKKRAPAKKAATKKSTTRRRS